MCIYIDTHTHTLEYYTALKKKEILSFAAIYMNMGDIMQSEISQTQEDKSSMIPLI